MTGIGCEVVAAAMGHTDSVTVEEKQKPRHLGENPFRLWEGPGRGSHVLPLSGQLLETFSPRNSPRAAIPDCEYYERN